MCDEIVDVKAKRMTEKQKQLQQTLMKKNATYKTQSFYILLVFY